MNYKHTQVGHLMLFALLIISLFFGVTFSASMFFEIVSSPIELFFNEPIILVLILVILASFSTLTVSIDEKYLRLKFGFGLFKKSFLLNDIVSVKAVKNPWYCGWGIRLIPHGWLFNVSGFEAVEIVMKNGKVYRIGTDEVEKLVVAITLSKK